jgi:hypothetical protein
MVSLDWASENIPSRSHEDNGNNSRTRGNQYKKDIKCGHSETVQYL